MATFISKKENLYCTSEKKFLKNLVTQINAEGTVANSLLNCLKYSQTRFKEFYTKVYIDKIYLLHHTMTRYNLPQLDDVIEELPNMISKICIKLPS